MLKAFGAQSNRSSMRLWLLANGRIAGSMLTGSLRLATMNNDAVADWLSLAVLVLFISTMAFGIAAIIA